jgi:hypothetical protein
VASSKPITWIVSDVLDWFKSRELVVNEAFQRHSVWTPQAKTLFIDSILCELPIPKIFVRTKVDVKRKKTVKEIVDGQQRIRSIVEYANDEFALNSKSENFQGKKYSDLGEDVQEIFLGYTLTAEQLLNATDDDVIDIFARLNSYTVALNATEKRHAAYQTELKFFVRRMSVKFRWFIEKYSIFSVKQRFRMADDEFFAELTNLVINGIQDGGAAKLNQFYKDTPDEVFDEKTQKNAIVLIDESLRFIDTYLDQFLKGLLGKHYQIYAICAAYLHILGKIPQVPELPTYSKLRDTDSRTNRLLRLETELEGDKETDFKKASGSSTQRIRTRRIRIRAFIEALGE